MLRHGFLLVCALAMSPAGSGQNDPIDAYRPIRKHQELFEGLDTSPDAGHFDKAFLAILSVVHGDGSVEERKRGLLEKIKLEVPGVYSFPVFTPEFCARFLDELDNYRDSGPSLPDWQ